MIEPPPGRPASGRASRPPQPLQFGLLLALSIAAAPAAQDAARPGADCSEWRQCRDMALAAREAGDFERFHDLAWRVVQTGPPRDPALMHLLARAQSLSGRPDDALVMLRRIAALGVPTDARTHDDFRRVRSLDGWPALDRLNIVLAASRPVPVPVSSLAGATPPAPRRAARKPAPPRAASSAPALAPAGEPAPGTPGTAVAPAPRYTTEEVLRLPRTGLQPTGLAYDRASGRFVLADRRARKLVIVDEQLRHVVDLVRASSAGFYDITAFEIDLFRGDLWVVSVNAAPEDDEPASVLHKLQLVSGRPLASLPLPGRFGAARFEDVAVSRGGAVFVLDAGGGRLFRLSPGAAAYPVPWPIALDGLTSVAPVDDRVAYVAHAEGLARVDTSTGVVIPVGGPENLSLAGFERIRWDRDALVGVQRGPGDARRLVRVRFAARGRLAQAIDVVADEVALADPTAAALADESFYFLVRDGGEGGGATSLVVRGAKLR